MLFPDILTVILPSALPFLYLSPSPPIKEQPPCFSLRNHLFFVIAIFSRPFFLPHDPPFTFLASEVTLGYILTTEDLELVSQIKKNIWHMSFEAWTPCLIYSQYFLGPSISWKFYYFIFLYSRIAFCRVYVPCFPYPFISWMASRLFLFLGNWASMSMAWGSICGIGQWVL